MCGVPGRRVEALRHAVVSSMGLRAPGHGARGALFLPLHDPRLDGALGRVERRGSRPTPDREVEPQQQDYLAKPDLVSDRGGVPLAPSQCSRVLRGVRSAVGATAPSTHSTALAITEAALMWGPGVGALCEG